MFSWREAMWLAALLLSLAGPATAQSNAYPGVGRAATPKEVAAWDIDVRPDFKGLPKGAGTVAAGMVVWESKCASCHGVFGESNEVFAPIVGGTTADDILTGRVARLNDAAYPGRTTFMKLASLSTLWDYIRRAMPWNQPKSLSTDEVYAVTAFLLNLAGVVPDHFTLSDQNMAAVQQRMPNRSGMTHDHALWPGAGLTAGAGTGEGKGAGQAQRKPQRKPDVMATACMKDCARDIQLASFLPDFARDAHGNLAEQNREVGAQKGADTRRPASATAAESVAPSTAPSTTHTSAPSTATAATALAQKHSCVACHGIENKIIGPGFREIAKKYAGRGDAAAYLAGKISAGSAGVWGAMAMPPQALSAVEAQLIAQWLADGMKK